LLNATIQMQPLVQEVPNLLCAYCSLTQRLATKHQTAARSTLSFPPAGWGGEIGKRGNPWVEIKMA